MSSSDDRDGRSAVGSVRGLSMGNDVELLQNAFATWRWCVYMNGLSGDEADYVMIDQGLDFDLMKDSFIQRISL